MSYTHHFWRRTDIDPVTWEAICRDFKQVQLYMLLIGDPVPIIAGWDGPPSSNKLPQRVFVNKERIRFHPNELEEMFQISSGPVNSPKFLSCNTRHLPYDIWVCVTLLIVHDHAPDCYSISSDGTRAEWQPALNLFKDALQRPGRGLPPGI